MRKHVEEAMNAQTNLAVFGAVQSILESGAIHGPTPAAAARIIKICLAEQQRQLRIMDRALEKAEKGSK